MLTNPISNSLAEAFAQQCAMWSAQAGAHPDIQQQVRRVAGLLVSAINEGHVYLDLASLDGDGVLTPDEWKRSGVVCLANSADPMAVAPMLRPMVLDGHRLYLARHYQSEVSTALALRQMAETGRLCIISGGPGTGKTTTVARLLGRFLAVRPDARIALAAPTGKAAARMMEALQARASELPEIVRNRLPQVASTLHRLLGWHPKQDKPRHHAGNPLWLDVLIVDEASMLDQTLAAQLLAALPSSATLILLGDKDQLAAVEAGAVFAEISDLPGCLPSDTIALDGWLDETLGLGMSPTTRKLVAAAQLAARNAALKAAERKARKRQLLADQQPDLFADLLPSPTPPLGEPLVADQEADTDTPRRLQDCVVWLQTSYRFRADSALGKVAAAVREGDVAKSLHTLLQASKTADSPQTDCAWLDEAEDGLSRRAGRWLLAGYQPYQIALQAWVHQEIGIPELFDAFDRFRVLAAIHGGQRGVRAINQLIDETRITWLAWLTPTVAAQTGQPILILANDTATGLFNGDVGLILPDASGAMEAWFPAGTTYRNIPVACLPRHDLAFAMTIHKSQGSEFDRVALVLPDEELPILTRELVYTGLTRARHGVAVLATADILAAAIANPTQRDTGLGERLR